MSSATGVEPMVFYTAFGVTVTELPITNVDKGYSKHPHIRTHNFRGQTDCVLIYRMLSEKSASGCS